MNVSKNAIAQALKIINPEITKKQFLKLLELPDTFTTTNRYWNGTYNILKWEDRNEVEQLGAIETAKQLLSNSKAVKIKDEQSIETVITL